ncbi:hypothetical protein D3C75_702800 [compost metagenome]
MLPAVIRIDNSMHLSGQANSPYFIFQRIELFKNLTDSLKDSFRILQPFPLFSVLSRAGAAVIGDGADNSLLLQVIDQPGDGRRTNIQSDKLHQRSSSLRTLSTPYQA